MADTTESDLNRMRRDAGLNRMAGHEGTRAQWEASVDGQRFLAAEKDREKAIKAEAEQAETARKESDKKTAEYEKALDAGRKAAAKAVKDTKQ